MTPASPRLRGLSVLVTRPRESSRELRRRLLEAGARVVELPLIVIDHAGPTPELDEALDRLGTFDWIVFTSAHGVAGFWRRLRALGKRLPRRVRTAAVGAATARALHRRGVRSVLVPRVETARGLLAAVGETIRGRARILLPRSDRARRTLPDGLRRRGHEVHAVVAYRNVAPPRPGLLLRLAAQGADAALFYSPSAIREFRRTRLSLPNARIACVGPTTAAAARRTGLRVDAVPADATPRAMVEALARAVFRHGRMSPARKSPTSNSVWNG